jgi:hypothetical protein
LGGTRKDAPLIAFGLALAGGIIIILAGLEVLIIGAALTFFVGGVGGIFGLFGAVCGFLIMVFAFMLRSAPDQHVGLGIAIIVFSLLSWFGSFGGFAIGFLLALVGGILAIIWRPSAAQVNVATRPAPSQMSGSAGASTGSPRFRPN